MSVTEYIDLPSDQQPLDVVRGKVCPYCGERTTKMDSAALYRGTSYGDVFACLPCGAYVGIHKVGSNKGRALGRLAVKELRAWKQRAHKKLDSLWKTKERRDKCYKLLAIHLGIPRDRCHIGMFNVDQCQRAIEILERET